MTMDNFISHQAAVVDREGAVLGFVTVTENRAAGRRILEQLEEWVIEERPDVELVAVDFEER